MPLRHGKIVDLGWIIGLVPFTTKLPISIPAFAVI